MTNLGNNILDSPKHSWQNGAEYIKDALTLAFPVGLAHERRLIMNFTAYFDESGTHDNSQVVAVAGYVAVASCWVEFSAQWQIALDEWGLDHFHMTDFAVKAPPYDKWTELERRQRLTRLIGIINEHVLGSVGILIPKNAFDEIFSARAKSICGGAYGLATAACWMDLAEIMREKAIDGWVSYVFEAGAPGAGEIAKVFGANLKDLEQQERLRLLSLRFEDKRNFLPLQAADLLAYELYRDLPREVGWERKTPRYPLTALAAVPRRWGYLDEAELRKWSGILSMRAATEDSGELPPL